MTKAKPDKVTSRPSSRRPLSRRLRPLWSHLLLFSFAVVFLYPFLWMVSTSMKTDEEISENRVLPEIPIFRSTSPYVRPTDPLAQPPEARDDLWRELQPELTALAENAVSRAPVLPGAEFVDAKAYRAASGRDLSRRAAAMLEREIWRRDRREIVTAYSRRLTAEAAAGAMENRLARLEIRSLQVQTLDGLIHPIWLAGQDSPERWQVSGGEAALLEGAEGEPPFLRYRFGSGGDPPVRLRMEFNFPGDPAELHKLIFGLRADDSWHRIEAVLTVRGQVWRSQRPTPLSQHRPMSIIFQPPTFDDETFKARTWVPLRQERFSSLNQQPAPASLEITIAPSSTARAIYGKAVRNYVRAFNLVPFWTYVGNSLLLVALTTAGVLFSASFVGYAFARLRWPGRSTAFLLLLSTMMLPPQVTMVPQFMIWRKLDWYNTLNPIWVPAWFGVAFFIFLMVQTMRSIPRELEEAAHLDGLNPYQTWWYVIMPQVKPALAAIAILGFLGAWNEFMGPLIYLRDQAKFPLSLGLFGFRLDGDVAGDWSVIMAGNVLMTLPVLLIFFLCQRYFIQGVTATGMKG